MPYKSRREQFASLKACMQLPVLIKTTEIVNLKIIKGELPEKELLEKKRLQKNLLCGTLECLACKEQL